MGYRSDAQLLFYCDENDPNYAMLKLWVYENMQEELGYMEEFTRSGHKGFIFSWDNVKWYQGYDDVDRVEAAMKKFREVFDEQAILEEGVPDFSYEFIRIGENDDDVEVRGSVRATSLIYVERSIEWNG